MPNRHSLAAVKPSTAKSEISEALSAIIRWFGSVTTLSVIYKLYPKTIMLNDKDKFIWLMGTENSHMFYLLQQLLSSLSEERIDKLKS